MSNKICYTFWACSWIIMQLNARIMLTDAISKYSAYRLFPVLRCTTIFNHIFYKLPKSFMFYTLHKYLQLSEKDFGWLVTLSVGKKETQPKKPVRVREWSWPCFITHLHFLRHMLFQSHCWSFPSGLVTKNQETDPLLLHLMENKFCAVCIQNSKSSFIIPHLELLWNRRLCPHQDFLSTEKKP